MRKIFISYARENSIVVRQLADHLEMLRCETWYDKELQVGQNWWDEILKRIAACDTFITIISTDALVSKAWERERQWAEELAKPVLPVAVEPVTDALPRQITSRQYIDYSQPAERDRAALALAGALASMEPAPPLPDPMPAPPAAPSSYQTDLLEDVSRPYGELDHKRQREIVYALDSALRSFDPAERLGGNNILHKFSSREDLYADVGRLIDKLSRDGQLPSPDVAVPSSAPVVRAAAPKEEAAENEVQATRADEAHAAAKTEAETILASARDEAEQIVADAQRRYRELIDIIETPRGGLTAEDVHAVAFSRPPKGKTGYNEDEVDAFLDLVENTLRKSDPHVSHAARREAETILEQAREEATAIQQAAASAASAGTDLERSKVEKRLEQLRTFEREYRTRLKTYIETQLDALGPSPQPVSRSVLEGAITELERFELDYRTRLRTYLREQLDELGG